MSIFNKIRDKFTTKLEFSVPDRLPQAVTPTDEELDCVIKELAARIVDIVGVGTQDKVRDTLRQQFPTNRFHVLCSQDSIVINYRIEMCVGDVLQIISRIRRGRR